MTYDRKAKRRRQARRLTEAFVRNAKPGFYADAQAPTLALRVKDTGSRSWIQRITIGGKQVVIGLGPWPVVTLAEARDAALDNRRAVHKGSDPRAVRHKAHGTPTFAEALGAVLAIHAKTWRNGKTERHWRSTLGNYAGPLLARPVDAITTGDVLAVLKPHWSDKRATMRCVHQRIGTVMKWAIVEGHRTDDPTHAVLTALPRNGVQQVHRQALPHAEVKAALVTVRASKADRAVRLMLEFLVLTGVRSNEVRGARWVEVDCDVWAVPAARTKTRKEHRVPLSPRALAVLAEAKELADGLGLVFPGGRGRPLGDRALIDLVRRLGIAGTVHGFRSSLRDWCAETGKPREVAEAALAHVVGGVEGAYFRSDLFERRRGLMNEWADYLS